MIHERKYAARAICFFIFSGEAAYLYLFLFSLERASERGRGKGGGAGRGEDRIDFEGARRKKLGINNVAYLFLAHILTANMRRLRGSLKNRIHISAHVTRIATDLTTDSCK